MNNREIIEDFYRTGRQRLLAYACACLHSSYEAEDVVQEVFVRLLTGNRLITPITLPNLAFTLCRHLLVDIHRRRCVRRDAEHELTRLSGTVESAESLLSMHQTTEMLERSMARLSAESSRLYRLHIIGDMPIRNICKQTSLPYKTVEYRIGQARKQVRYYMQHIV